MAGNLKLKPFWFRIINFHHIFVSLSKGLLEEIIEKNLLEDLKIMITAMNAEDKELGWRSIYPSSLIAKSSDMLEDRPADIPYRLDSPDEITRAMESNLLNLGRRNYRMLLAFAKKVEIKKTPAILNAKDVIKDFSVVRKEMTVRPIGHKAVSGRSYC